MLVVFLTLVAAGGDGALALLANQRLVDVGDDTTAGNGGLDQGVQLLVTTDSKLEMSGGDSLDFEILGSISCQLQNLSSQVLEDGRAVDSGSGSDTTVTGGPGLEMSVDTANRELKSSTSRSGNCLLL